MYSVRRRRQKFRLLTLSLSLSRDLTFRKHEKLVCDGRIVDGRAVGQFSCVSATLLMLFHLFTALECCSQCRECQHRVKTGHYLTLVPVTVNVRRSIVDVDFQMNGLDKLLSLQGMTLYQELNCSTPPVVLSSRAARFPQTRASCATILK